VILEELEWPFWNAFGNSYVCMHLLVGLKRDRDFTTRCNFGFILEWGDE